MRSYSFVQTAPEAGDCTAPYDIRFSKQLTVREFVNEVLQQNEWGYIDVYDPNDEENWHRKKNCSCFYRQDEIKTSFPEDILDKVIISATAHGGWTRMDYTLTLEE